MNFSNCFYTKMESVYHHSSDVYVRFSDVIPREKDILFEAKNGEGIFWYFIGEKIVDKFIDEFEMDRVIIPNEYLDEYVPEATEHYKSYLRQVKINNIIESL